MAVRRIGVLMAGDRSYPAYAAFSEALTAGAAQAGLAIETIERFAAGRHERLPTLAAEILAGRPDLVVAIGAVSHYALRAVAGDAVPIVFAIVIDPVASGIMPGPGMALGAGPGAAGGGVTGVTSFDPDQTAAQIRLLRETLGPFGTLAVIGDADVPPLLAGIAREAAEAQGLRPEIRLLRSPDEIAPAIAAFREAGAGGLLGLEVPRINTHCHAIAEAATAAGLPTVFGRDMARAAPLLAYGTSLSEACRLAAGQAIRIAAGAAAGDLPVERALATSLSVNLATARRLGVTPPPAILAAAAQVVD